MWVRNMQGYHDVKNIPLTNFINEDKEVGLTMPVYSLKLILRLPNSQELFVVNIL